METFLSHVCKMNFNVTLYSVLLYLYLLGDLFGEGGKTKKG